MANEKYGSSSVFEQAPAHQGEDEDVLSGASGSWSASATAPAQARPYTPTTAHESQFAHAEVTGDESLIIDTREGMVEAGLHQEVGSAESYEAAEEYIEASPEQLARAEAGEETAVSDLRGIEGFEMPGGTESAGAAVQHQLRDAGVAIEGGPQEEFLPILAALAPTLISAVGPAVAKAVKSRLSPRAAARLKTIKKAAAPAVGQVVKGLGGRSNLLPLIAKLLESAEQRPGGESGLEAVDEALVEEAVAAMEVIIGTDDRVRITQTTGIPFRRICALRITFPSGALYRGTGFLIGPRAVATAGHCVFLHNQGGWARKVEVIPGCNGTSRPFGQVESTSFRSVGGWVNGKKPESDYGCVVLNSGAFGGRNLGSFGFAAFPPATLLAQPAVVAGYPGDKPFAELWGMARKIKAVTPATLVYEIDTVGGQSGAPVYIKRNGQRYVVGIHNYGAAAGNSATRVTQPVYQRLLAWSKI